MEIQFDSLEELYHRLEPALKSKVSDLKRNDYIDIDEKDVWNYLSKTKWIHDENLSLHEMVEDIFGSSNELIAQFKKENEDR